MDPFTLTAILKGAQAVGSGVSSYIAADQAFGQSEEDRLKELQRREELGTLGFTGEEQNRIMRQMLNPIQARERQRDVQTRALLGGGDLGASQAAIANLIQGDKEEAARAGAGESFLQQQMIEKSQQEKELRALEKAKDAEEAAKTQAILSAITLGIAGQAETQQRRMDFEEARYGEEAARQAALLKQYQQKYGMEDLTPEEFAESQKLSGYTPGSGM